MGGGISDRPGDMVDVFHTQFGVAGLDMILFPLLAFAKESGSGLSFLGYPGLNDVDPVYCLPAHITERKGLRKRWKTLPRREQ